jgi:exodeoxyribonuclease-3
LTIDKKRLTGQAIKKRTDLATGRITELNPLWKRILQVNWKVATFNANSIRARLPIILDWLQENQPDLLCIQETKVQDKDFPQGPLAEAGWKSYFWGQKSYNGVAVLSREEPEEVQINFPDGSDEDQARLIAVKTRGVWVVNTYVPQGRDPEDPAFAYKLEFFERMGKWFESEFSSQKPLLWLGDLNVAPEPIDVYDPVKLDGRVCFHPKDRGALKKVMEWGFIDLFRKYHPDETLFTFWDYRARTALERNHGWRIDHLLATAPLAETCRNTWVDIEPRKRERPSDHTFLVGEFELPAEF